MSKRFGRRTTTLDLTKTRIQPFSKENILTKKQPPPRENKSKNSIQDINRTKTRLGKHRRRQYRRTRLSFPIVKNKRRELRNK